MCSSRRSHSWTRRWPTSRSCTHPPSKRALWRTAGSRKLRVGGRLWMTNAASSVSLPATRGVSRGCSFGRTLRQSQAAYILLAPFLILFVLVLAYPLLYSLYLSFFNASLNQAPTFVGTQHFAGLFTDSDFLASVRNTAFFTVFTVIGETTLPLLMAVAMNEH